MSIAIAGFLMGLSLIVAIGPQNALIIRQGVKREGVLAVLLVCIISDIILIFGGTAGVGALVERAPIALVVMKWLGAAYLLYFGISCWRDALKRRGDALTVEETEPEYAESIEIRSQQHSNSSLITAPKTRLGKPSQRSSVEKTHAPHRPWVKPVLAALAFTWLNPAAYIDVLVMLGGIANQHGETGRWVFASGALAASFVWFPFIGFTSLRFAHVLARPTVWRYINIAIGVIMFIMCARLLMH
ncbi:LysE/ArgO family amino acid transporter [Corynebacterium pseudotuberculosis]|uniref:LysE/ArgO family amino acid transporter n=1 Tax=Corynebacterium pseudotuberculosis TaxID=1719 RepID=UPI0002660697|nr:LysE/ArgO family amino acid transporter [Corynebacterium pseudotuberculosis]AFM07236.1 LysE family transporter [Corynebacterium pseudotuberculosis Cp162]AKP08545.1 Lysine exporter protein [Corynebacterium pseudotuberculosis]APG81456.1 Lysine exporter protein [Corynebacterium pseudotuberculosis]WFP68055.1 LysE/ArgO family amino acid transporter [Corynebacterium pseudotuberculosis]